MSSSGDSGRRFLIIRFVLVMAVIVLMGRIFLIQVIHHDEYKKIGDRQWVHRIPINAERGSLHDRTGKPLALSVTTWRVGVATSLTETPNKLAGCLGPMLGLEARELRTKFKRANGRHVVLIKDAILTREDKQRLQREEAVTMKDMRSRAYPYDGLAASLIGFFHHETDQDAAGGLEYSLAGYLAGEQGLAQEIETGVAGRNLGRVVLAEATHGHSLDLTLDVELQEICERKLAASVDECGAVGGSVLILDPANGDILAAASWPLLSSRNATSSDLAVWNNSNFTCQYEPGSTFKIFTMTSLLRHGAVDTATVFDCTDTRFSWGKMRNSDGHSYGHLSLMRAFSLSSNIYFARAVENLSNREFYRDLVDFGFGVCTNLPYSGQAPGSLKSPASWSGRSKSTMAIGQELAVTPLQLGMAVCSVANGGFLYAPRLVTTIRNDDGQVTEELPPVRLRRVMPEPLAALLRQAMGRVVAEGTGVAARMDWINVGGKTGTAQKCREGKGYTPGAYVASFVGMAPLEDPRLVILTIIDEPVGNRHYAAQSAAPLFSEILREIRCRTQWLTDVPGQRTATLLTPDPQEQVTVPDVLHLSVPNAIQQLKISGCPAAGAERDGVVIQQVPGAGAKCPRGTVVGLTVAGRPLTARGADPICPDFSGLSNRQVRSLAARLGVPVVIRGAGYVADQDHRAGVVLAGGSVTVRMEAVWD